MENIAYKLMPVTCFAGKTPYCLRYRVQDNLLEQSIAKRGVITPLLVYPHPQPVVVAGHKRLHAAQASGLKQIGVFEIQEHYSSKELFALAVISNWNQAWLDLDRAWALRQAVDIHQWTEPEIIQDVLPALGLACETHVLKQYLQAARLEPALLDQIACGHLPFRGMHLLSRFSPEDQRMFAGSIAVNVVLTTNELIQLGEWLYDLLKLQGVNIDAFLKKEQFDSILNHPQWDLRQKAEKFCEKLRTLRFPKLARHEQQFKSIARTITDEKIDLKIEPPPSFEDQGIWLRAKIRDPQSLDRLLDLLKDKRNLLNSLFDIML